MDGISYFGKRDNNNYFKSNYSRKGGDHTCQMVWKDQDFVSTFFVKPFNPSLSLFFSGYAKDWHLSSMGSPFFERHFGD
jgi:hypothetical protein